MLRRGGIFCELTLKKKSGEKNEIVSISKINGDKQWTLTSTKSAVTYEGCYCKIKICQIRGPFVGNWKTQERAKCIKHESNSISAFVFSLIDRSAEPATGRTDVGNLDEFFGIATSMSMDLPPPK